MNNFSTIYTNFLLQLLRGHVSNLIQIIFSSLVDKLNNIFSISIVVLCYHLLSMKISNERFVLDTSVVHMVRRFQNRTRAMRIFFKMDFPMVES